MAPVRRHLSVAVGFGETDFARRKRLRSRWHLSRASQPSRRLYIFYPETAFTRTVRTGRTVREALEEIDATEGDWQL